MLEFASLASATSMQNNGNPLMSYFMANSGRSIHKWIHYLDIYHRHMERYRNQDHVSFLEIGVQNGGTAQMWKSYFGASTFAYTGIDIDPECRDLEKDGFDIVIGDQADKAFLKKFAQRGLIYDVILDDGGHTMEQQINSFEALFGSLRNGGIYIVEDTHTSYMPAYGGGLRAQTSFIEYIKGLVDCMHGWYYEPDSSKRSHLGCSLVGSISIYDSIVIVEKKIKNPPAALAIGRAGHVKNPEYITYRDITGFSQ